MDHDVTERVRRAIYDSFARRGSAPSHQQIQSLCAVDEAEIDQAVTELAARRHLVLDNSGDIVMAHPFTAVNLGFSVMGERTLWWGGCAWDSFAIPNLVENEPSVLVATTCPGCRGPLAWTVTRSGPPEGDEVAHFLVPMDAVWDDVIYACSNQRLFCSEDCVHAWLTSTGHPKGYIMDLATLGGGRIARRLLLIRQSGPAPGVNLGYASLRVDQRRHCTEVSNGVLSPPTTRSAARPGDGARDNRYCTTHATRQPPHIRSPRAGPPVTQRATTDPKDPANPKEKTM